MPFPPLLMWQEERIQLGYLCLCHKRCCREIVKRLDMWGIDMLFVVGGNGGNAGANAIQQKCAEAGVICNVIGVPKSIDNDILLIDKCFGFDTAVEEAQRALLAAKVRAGYL